MILRLEPLTSAKLSEFRNLLGSNDFGGCFCAVWTSYGEDWVKRCEDPSQPNYLITKKNVEMGAHVGFLVYQDQELVAWTGTGPKTALSFLKTKLGSRLSGFSPEVWSVGCLAIKAAWRGKGLADLIIRAVKKEAVTRGATSIEAYPVRPFHEPRVFRGTMSLYERNGFVEVGSEKDGDHEIVLMRWRPDHLNQDFS